MHRTTLSNFSRLAQQYLVRYKGYLVAGAVFVTLSNICSALYPRLIGQTVDLIVAHHASLDLLLQRIGLILALTIGSGVFMFATRKTVIVSSRKIEYELRRDFLTALERHPQRFYDRMPTGVLMAHATNDIAAVREFLGPAIMYSANTITTFLFVVTLMIMIDPVTTALALTPLPLIAWSTYVVGKRIYTASRTAQEEYSFLTRQVQEAFSGIRIVRAFEREEYEERLFSVRSQHYSDSNLRLARLQALFMPSMMLLVGLSQLIVLIAGGYKAITGSLSVGQLTQFFIYVGQLIWPIAAIGWVTGIIQRSAASLDRLYAIFDVPAHQTTLPQKAKHFPAMHRLPSTCSIEFKNVSFEYTHGKPALEHITLCIAKGEHIGIVGPLGSGKSTLLKLLTKLYEPSKGTININRVPLDQIDEQTVRKLIALVPQEVFLFSMTIAENIRVGNPTATDEEIVEAAKIAGIAFDIDQFPHKYNTIVGERGILLSGGQRQRLAIARAVIVKPEILLLDDALSAVDTATERQILSHIRTLSCTTIIVSHRLSSIEHCHRIFVIEHGHITAHGSHHQLLESNQFYRTLYQRQRLEEKLKVPPSINVHDGVSQVNT